MGNIDGHTRDRLLEISGFQLGTFLFRYLGISLAMKRLHTADYEALIVAVVDRLISWPTHILSYTEKLQLARMVLQGIKCFWFSILLVPSCVVDKLYYVCRVFVWTSRHLPIS